MNEQINAWILKEKEELENKLAREISSSFWVSESLAKKMIYETHLSLEWLKNEILKSKKEFNEDKDNIDEILSDEQLMQLLEILKKAKKKLNN